LNASDKYACLISQHHNKNILAKSDKYPSLISYICKVF
jgi:hypothetical protein